MRTISHLQYEVYDGDEQIEEGQLKPEATRLEVAGLTLGNNARLLIRAVYIDGTRSAWREASVYMADAQLTSPADGSTHASPVPFSSTIESGPSTPTRVDYFATEEEDE